MATFEQVQEIVEKAVNSAKAEMESNYKLHTANLVQDYHSQIGALKQGLEQEVYRLMQAKADAQASDPSKTPAKEKRPLTDRKGFTSLPKYGGAPDAYEDWKFQLKSFLSEVPGFA
jgi:hypothetical protein